MPSSRAELEHHEPPLAATGTNDEVHPPNGGDHGPSNGGHAAATHFLGESVLRRYALELDSSENDGGTISVCEVPQQHPPQLTTECVFDDPSLRSQTPNKRLAAGSTFPRVPVASPYSRRTHRKSPHSIEVPQQTIMKALASSSGGTEPSAPLPGSLSDALVGLKEATEDGTKESSPCLTATLAGLAIATIPNLSPTANLLLKSPCFFHSRLEGVLDLQKVLEDISDEDYSHSRLMQTATAVRESARHLQRRPIKKAARTIMIVTKARDNKLVHLTRELTDWLLSTPRYGNANGVTIYVDAKLRHSKRFDAAGLIRRDPRFARMLKYWTPDLCWSSPETFDLVLTLGGDGTVLFTSWLFQRIVPPILSFSMGSLGFLTNFSFAQYKESLNKVMGDAGMRINLRMRFTCTVWRADESANAMPGASVEGEQFEVLNELVIDRGPSPYVSNLEVWENNHLLTIIQADGCIFSTPTGSTAYSLSAGGALVSPEIPAVLLTPICPHTLSFRPMLLSDTVALRICVPTKSRASVYCSFDGKGRIELKRGDYVTLEASQYPFPTVMTGPNEWLESVQRKLQWNTREIVQQGWDDGNDDEGQDQTWDIDTDSTAYGGTDSGIGQSEDGVETNTAGTASPMRRQMSLLNM